jgi:stalled ribosome rescue protein Dom34
MHYQHVVVWIDHAQSHLIRFNAETSSTEVIRSHARHPHVHTKSAGGSGHAAPDVAYLHQVSEALQPSAEILIVGPGQEKLSLMKHLLQHHPATAEHVMSVETVDHPSDGQLLQYARKYFLRADMML